MNAVQFDFSFDAKKIEEELLAIRSSFTSIHSLRIEENALEGLHLITPAPEGSELPFKNTAELDKSPYLQSILSTFKCNKITYRVHNLKAGGVINLHRDLGSGLASNIVRIHIPVTTNEDIYFHVNEERVCMQNGECWFADITKLHKVENRSNSDRLQLMIDCDLNDWWETILTQFRVPYQDISEWEKYSLSELKKIKENLLQTSSASSTILKEVEMTISRKQQ